MPILCRQQAARELRISLSTFDRLTKNGTGKIKPGGRGRGRAALFDTAAIGALLPPRPSDRRRRTAEQLTRGALALTLGDAIADRLNMIRATRELFAFHVPHDKQHELVAYLEKRLRFLLAEHLKINTSKK